MPFSSSHYRYYQQQEQVQKFLTAACFSDSEWLRSRRCCGNCSNLDSQSACKSYSQRFYCVPTTSSHTLSYSTTVAEVQK